ncbi:YciI family protein [Microbacterium aerolatum]|uniref:YciI family protein n=1 Tax=Microbacterium aerolatum TaxID=153731 RepID=UPI003850E838
MTYFIQTFDRPGVEAQRAALRMEHLRYLDDTKHQLLACGAKLDEESSAPIGGVYLVDVKTREEAEAYIAGDPFTKANLFREIQIEQWRKAFFDRQRFVELG